MNGDREAFEAWTKERKFELDANPLDPWTVWQAALASERAKQAEPVLLNLALRLRMARRCLKQALSSNANQSHIDQLRGAEMEAWNSFQAAKAIASPPADDEAEMLRNLLARIHRDGGHYLHEHGLRKAVEDADEIVARLNAADDEAVRLLRKAKDYLDRWEARPSLQLAIDAYLEKVKK